MKHVFGEKENLLMGKLKYSYVQLTFGLDETYKHPEKSYQRLKKFGYDGIELCPPKGRYQSGVKLDDYVKTHKALTAEYGLKVAGLNECWGKMWDPYSPTIKTLTEPKTAALAVTETKIDIDIAAELGAPSVTVAVAIHADITPENVAECTAVAVDSLRTMCDYAQQKNLKLVFEATNHLEMGKYVNTAMNHRRIIELVNRKNLGIQLDMFHANFEELNPYEAITDSGELLWYLHCRDSNSLTPGYGTVDWKAVIRGLKKIGYSGYCTIESAPMLPDFDTAVKDGIEYLKIVEHIVDIQLSPEYPNGFAVHL
jgi:sugar phosphate isomerase/epimerase